MGYDINLRIRVYPASQYEQVTNAIEERFGQPLDDHWEHEDGLFGEGSDGDTKWSMLTEDLTDLSRSFPDATIQAYMEGEDGQRWIEYFNNGRTYLESQPDWSAPEEPPVPERFADPKLAPYTVVIAFRDDDDPQANREYTMQVLGIDGQDAAKRAIDQLIAARGLADAENMDTWRVDYDTIAIFEGNLTNLAR